MPQGQTMPRFSESQLPEVVENLHARVGEHDRLISELQRNDDAIMERLEGMATHEDVLDLAAKVESSINGLLRDALQAVPEHAANGIAKQAVVWAAIAAIATVGMLIIGIVTHHV